MNQTTIRSDNNLRKSIIAEQYRTFTPREILDLNYQTIIELCKTEDIALSFKKSDTFKHKSVRLIDKLVEISLKYGYAFKKQSKQLYLYLGTHWEAVDKELLQQFIGKISVKLGLDYTSAHFAQLNEKLYDQLMYKAEIPLIDPTEPTMVNLANGTLMVDINNIRLLPHSIDRFITYQLPFCYDDEAECNEFQWFLDDVLPDKALQNILAEYIGYLFIPNNKLKLEKTLLLYGKGANGKSVFFDIINALLGSENVSNYGLMHLTDDKGNYRAQLADKLLNYSSELDKKMNFTIFKQLVSGETIDAKNLYDNPFQMTNYARLMFNANELPPKAEQSNAYFRRIIIIPFEKNIPEGQQDKFLAKRIIDNELPGVLNWVLKGLARLLKHQTFTTADAAKEIQDIYRIENDNVLLFMEEFDYVKDDENYIPLSTLYSEYLVFCEAGTYFRKSKIHFSKSLVDNGFVKTKKNLGMVVHCKKRG